MLGFGSSEDHANSVTFGDDWGGLTAYTICFWIILNQSGAAGRDIFGKWSTTAGKEAWVVQMDSTDHIGVAHHDGSATVATSSTTALTVGTLYHVGLIWDGVTIDYYLDGVADGTPAFTRAIRASDAQVYLGARPPGFTVGCAMDIGEIALWEADIGSDGITNHLAGSQRDLDTQDFWFSGQVLQSPEFFGKTAVAANGGISSSIHQLTTCPFLPQGNFFSVFPGGSFFKVIDKDLEIPRTVAQAEILDKVIDKDVELMDGGAYDTTDPSGFREEAVTSSNNNITTTWKTIYPPFIKRTRWV